DKLVTGVQTCALPIFNARYGTSGYPKSNDPRWNDWRREQVTNFVRRVYLSAKAIRPSIKISAALIAWSNGPRASGGFEATEAYKIRRASWRGRVGERA